MKYVLDKKKVAALVIAGTLTTMMLTGCSKDEQDVHTNPKEIPKMEQIQETEKLPNKTFQPGEHVYFKRYYSSKNHYAETVNGGQVSVPEGYEILDIENFTEKFGYGSQTGGFDIWFINTATVEAEPCYNEVYNSYDYSEPGKVIVPAVEEESPTLKLTP